LSSGENAARDYPDPKARALKILNYSAMPGTSRHHWGTDIDLNALNNKYFGEGEGLKVYQWLTTHAAEYGFCQPYSKKGALRPEGYNEEKWHWSYLPVAKPLTDLAKQQLKNDMIKGFKGAEAATQIDVVKNYVLGINQDCL
jgi:LAS superfamily LD-carboxypeptidase LdcB